MQKKLTITLYEKVYSGLHQAISRRKIRGFIEDLVHPHVMKHERVSAYKAMAEDEGREREALEWSEATCGGSTH